MVDRGPGATDYLRFPDNKLASPVVSWKGRLAPLARRLNRYGLLSFDDAALAKALLPSEWRGDPHSQVTIWARYHVAPAGNSFKGTRASAERLR
jgi:hypothetical protein